MKLNDLLADAKQKLEAWETAYSIPLFEERRKKYCDNKKAWRSLRDEIDKSVPVKFLKEDGNVDVIGTIGCLTSDQMLYYSPNLNAQYCLFGYNLSAIVEFLEIDEN
jgi:hypothetical protein